MSTRMSKDAIICHAHEGMGYRGTELVNYPLAVGVSSEVPQRAAMTGRPPPSPGFVIQQGIEGLVTSSAKQSPSDFSYMHEVRRSRCTADRPPDSNAAT